MPPSLLTLIRSQTWFACQPDLDTIVAMISGLVWIPAYYLLVHLEEQPLSSIYSFLVLLLVVILPIVWLCWYRKRPLSEIGITSKRWKESLLISVIIGLPFFLEVITQYGARYGVGGLLPHFLVNGLILWEPFFVFCWLELRFGKAFGIIPGIVLAGAFFGAYHIGTYPPFGVLTLFLYGMLFAAIFRLTDNLLSMWPIAWAMSSAKGTLSGGMLFSWNDVGSTSVILVLQLAFILWMWRREKGRSARED